jgi:hypothetical protein
MTPVVACMVCAPPLDALLTNGLHAGVLVMALVALGVIAGLGRGVLRLVREDRASLVPQDVGQSFSSAPSTAYGGSSKELPYIAPLGDPSNPAGGRRIGG